MVPLEVNGSSRRGFYISSTILEGDSSVYQINHCFDQTLTSSGTITLCIPNQILTFTCGTQLSVLDAYFAWGSANAASNICDQTSGCADPKCDFLAGETPLFTPLFVDFEVGYECPGVDTFNTLLLTDMTLGGTAPYTYLWSFGDGGTSIDSSPIHSYSDTGAYIVQLVLTDATGLIDTVTKSITIDECSLLLCEVMGSPTVCAGDSIFLFETGIGATEWDWSGPAGFTSSNQLPVVFPSDVSYSGVYQVIIGDSYGQQDTCSTSVTVHPTLTDSIVYSGCESDGFSVLVNGTSYSESNPTGSEVMTSFLGCDSIIVVDLSFNPTYSNVISYNGCADDGYSTEINGTTYDVSNPTDTIYLTTSKGCDSLIIIDLNYNLPVLVDGGMLGGPICSNNVVPLSDLGAVISGGTTNGVWTSMGDGVFDNGGDFGGAMPATTYTPSEQEIDLSMIILTLTSFDPPGSCEPEADAVLVLINDIRCELFPWAGGN